MAVHRPHFQQKSPALQDCIHVVLLVGKQDEQKFANGAAMVCLKPYSKLKSKCAI